MKKLLIASTALVASAGFAAADVTLGGSANMGVKYDASAATKTTLHYEVDFDIKGSGTTDGGLTFGASLDVDQQIGAGGNPTLPAAVPNGNGITDPEVFISGEFGTLTVGGVDPATDGFGIADVGFDELAVDDDAESNKNTVAGSQNVHYTITFDAFTLTIAGHTISKDYSAAVKYDFGDFDAAVGYARDAGTGDSTTSIDLNGTFGDITVGAYYGSGTGTAANKFNGYGLDLTYTMGATKIIVAYGDTNFAGDGADYGIGAEYDLGGGAVLAGGIASVDPRTGAVTTRHNRADFGIKLTF